jgi:hypothetical protein
MCHAIEKRVHMIFVVFDMYGKVDLWLEKKLDSAKVNCPYSVNFFVFVEGLDFKRKSTTPMATIHCFKNFNFRHPISFHMMDFQKVFRVD